MTEQEWFSIPCHPLYETTRDGKVRWSIDSDLSCAGELITLKSFQDFEFYSLKCDYSGKPQAVSIDWIMFLAFDKDPLNTLKRAKEFNPVQQKHFYRWIVGQGVLPKLLSNEFSSEWNTFLEQFS